MDEQDPALSQENETEPVNPPAEELGEEETEETEPHDDQEALGLTKEEPEEEAEEAHEEVQLVIEGEEPPPARGPAPRWVKELREQHRALKARNAELERELNARTQPVAPVAPGAKPTLDACDYDPARFEQEMEAWHTRKRAADQQEAEARADEERKRQEWNQRLVVYGKTKEELSKQIPSFAEAETTVQSILDLAQQGVIVAAADNPAMVVCALGQNPKLAQDLAKERDPIRFAFKVAKLEARLKMAKKNNAPPPEKPVKGTGGVSGAVDSQLERLRADAARTGDYTKVLEYKRRKQQK